MDATDSAYCSTDLTKLETINSRNLGGQGRVSSKWVEIIKHPTRDEWAAIIPESYMFTTLPKILTQEELQLAVSNGFKSKSEMVTEGWLTNE